MGVMSTDKSHEGSTGAAGLAGRPVHPALGFEITGLDLKAVTAGDAKRIERAFDTHGAVLFRSQDLGPDDLIRFSRFFGELDPAPVNEKGRTVVDGYPELYVVSNIKGDDGQELGSLGAVEAAWHADMSYLDQPPRASLLYAVEIPDAGGDTWLAGMEAALRDMPAALRRRIEGKLIKHDGTYNSGGYLRQGMENNDDPVTCPGTFHPAICRHPRSNRDVLYLGRRRNAYVEGLALADSEALLDDLWAHATDARFTYGHRWQVGDVLMWDNWATLHRRDAFDPAARRYMLRTQVAGSSRPHASPAGGA